MTHTVLHTLTITDRIEKAAVCISAQTREELERFFIAWYFGRTGGVFRNYETLLDGVDKECIFDSDEALDAGISIKFNEVWHDESGQIISELKRTAAY